MEHFLVRTVIVTQDVVCKLVRLLLYIDIVLLYYMYVCIMFLLYCVVLYVLLQARDGMQLCYIKIAS